MTLPTEASRAGGASSPFSACQKILLLNFEALLHSGLAAAGAPFSYLALLILCPHPLLFTSFCCRGNRGSERGKGAQVACSSVPGLPDLLPGQCQEVGQGCSSDHLELLTPLICPHPSLPPIFSLLIWLLPPPPLPETCGLLTHLSTWCPGGVWNAGEETAKPQLDPVSHSKPGSQR